MIDDEERREIATRLRELCDYSTAETIVRICLELDDRELMNRVTRRMSDRIADLIDPDTRGQCPKSCPEMSGIDPDTRKCDRDALLELADEMEAQADTGMCLVSRTCHGCAADNPGGSCERESMMEASRRIRDALGVKDG